MIYVVTLLSRNTVNKSTIVCFDQTASLVKDDNNHTTLVRVFTYGDIVTS